MTSLQGFVKAQILDVRRAPSSPPPLSACLRVGRVAYGSVAAELGVRAGDVLVTVDGSKAGRMAQELYTVHRDHKRYRFYSTASRESIEARTTGIELGCRLAPTVEAVRETFDPQADDFDLLLEFWHAGAWQDLDNLAGAALNTYEPKTLAKLFGAKPERNTPSLVLRGAAAFELGRVEEAMALFEEYDRHYSSYWTMNFTGLIDYYRARVMASRGQLVDAQEIATQAHIACGYDRTAALVEQLTGVRPPDEPTEWLGRPFPVNYNLPTLGARSGRVILGDALQAMHPGQVFLVCLLATYRGNGPYDDFMQRYRNYGTFFSPFVAGLHVVTMEPEMRPDRPEWYRTEAECVALGLPVSVLYDDGAVTNAVQPRGSPQILALAKDATVLYEGSLPPHMLWATLAKLHAARPA